MTAGAHVASSVTWLIHGWVVTGSVFFPLQRNGMVMCSTQYTVSPLPGSSPRVCPESPSTLTADQTSVPTPCSVDEAKRTATYGSPWVSLFLSPDARAILSSPTLTPSVLNPHWFLVFHHLLVS